MAFTWISKIFGSDLIARWVIVHCVNLNFDETEFRYASWVICEAFENICDNEFRNGQFIWNYGISQWFETIYFGSESESGSKLEKVSDPDPIFHFLNDFDPPMLQNDPKQCCESETTYVGAGSEISDPVPLM